MFHSSSTISAASTATVNKAWVGSGTFTNATRFATVDANATAYTTGTLANTNTDAGIVVGAYQTGGNFLCGQIAEISVFSRLFTTAERRAMVDYRGRKWSVTLAPSAPLSPATTPSAGQLAVSWSVPSSGGRAPVTGDTATAVSGGSCTTTTATTCTITGPTGGTTYTVNVTATNSAGTGVAATTAGTTPAAAPAAPTGLTAARGNQHATASWTAPNNDGSAITSYTVTATPGNLTCTTTTLSCQVSGLTNGTAYTLTVTATNAVGTSPALSAVTVTPAPVAGPPSAVTSSAGDSGGSVTWTAPSDNGGTAIVSYTATAVPTDSSLATRTCTSSGTSCSFTGMTNGAPTR